MIAALYVETNGVYFGMPDVDEKRDARKYAGPWPVVAHPPCHLWTNLAAVNFKRYGGEHNRPGNDGDCFEAALAAVQLYGGVLEHPAGSHAWKAFALARPTKLGWNWSGFLNTVHTERGGIARRIERHAWTCEVWQSAYGHKARKRTWLYYVGPRPPELDWRCEPGTHQCGWFDRNKPTLGKREASRTPLAFRDALLELARTAKPR